MSITQQTMIDRIEVLSNGIIQVRQALVSTDGEKEIGRQFTRWVLKPGDDVSDQTAEVQQVCTDTWTQEVVSAYLASQNA